MVRSAVGSPREVVFVDGVRTPFGKAGAGTPTPGPTTSIVKVIRELLRRNPGLPPERIDEVAIAATTQIGDQGLTLGRSAGILAGLPQSVPGYSIDRMCAGAMTAVTSLGPESRPGPSMSGSPEASSTWVTPDGRRHRPEPALCR